MTSLLFWNHDTVTVRHSNLMSTQAPSLNMLTWQK